MELQDKCVRCGEPLIVRIYKNRAGGKQQGLYCGSCGKYYKFLTNEEVYYAFYKKYKIVNEFGDLSNTKLKQLKLPQADNKNKVISREYVEKNYISIKELKKVLDIEEYENIDVLSYISTLKSEVYRLEDIEDRKVQIEYQLVFDKGVKSVEEKIKDKLEKYNDAYMTININNRSAGKTFKQAVNYEVRKVLNELLQGGQESGQESDQEGGQGNE